VIFPNGSLLHLNLDAFGNAKDHKENEGLKTDFRRYGEVSGRVTLKAKPFRRAFIPVSALRGRPKLRLQGVIDSFIREIRAREDALGNFFIYGNSESQV